MSTKRRRYLDETPRASYYNINVSDTVPTRRNIDSINNAYSSARKEAIDIANKYELAKRNAVLQNNMNNNLEAVSNNNINFLGTPIRPQVEQQLQEAEQIVNRLRPSYKIGGRKRSLARSSSPAIIDSDTVRYDNMVRRYGYANQFGGNRHHRPGYYSEKVRNSDGSSSIVSYPYVYPYRMENRGSDIMLYDRSGNNIIDVLPAGAVISKGTNDVINRLNSRPTTIPRGIGIVPVDNTYVRPGRRIRRRPMPGIPPRPRNFIGRGGNFGGGGGGDQYSW